MNKRKANARKREKVKIEKEKRDLHKEITRLIGIDEMKVIPENMKAALRLKLTGLVEKYKSKYGDKNVKAN